MNTKHLCSSLTVLAAMLCFASAAQAQSSPEALYTKSLAATCANCHGTNGAVVSGSPVVGLAGMPKEYFAAQMIAFKTGTRPATVMHQLAKGYSDAQIVQLATFFASQKK
jgi:cytochrome subunit of sulfide dehydrogenase